MSELIRGKTAQKPFIHQSLPTSNTDTFNAAVGGPAGSRVIVGARAAADNSTNRTHITGTFFSASGTAVAIDIHATVSTTSGGITGCTSDGVLTPAN